MNREVLSKKVYLSNLKRRSVNTYYSHNTAINSFDRFLKDTGSNLEGPLNTLNSFVE